MNGLTDFHSHILPGVDDGSASVEESLAMLEMAACQGVRQMVATPHFYANQDSPARFLQRRREAESRLSAALAAGRDLPRITMGAEVYFFPGISESEGLRELAIGETNCILIEMPRMAWTDKMYRELAMIPCNQGLTPIIAHVDRYLSPMHTRGIPERLMELPVLVQANAGFFLNRWTEGMALRMLKKGQIHLLGSDCHDRKHRPPRLGEAATRIGKHLGNGALERLTDLSAQILRGEEIFR